MECSLDTRIFYANELLIISSAKDDDDDDDDDDTPPLFVHKRMMMMRSRSRSRPEPEPGCYEEECGNGSTSALRPGSSLRNLSAAESTSTSSSGRSYHQHHHHHFTTKRTIVRQHRLCTIPNFNVSSSNINMRRFLVDEMMPVVTTNTETEKDHPKVPINGFQI